MERVVDRSPVDCVKLLVRQEIMFMIIGPRELVMRSVTDVPPGVRGHLLPLDEYTHWFKGKHFS